MFLFIHQEKIDRNTETFKLITKMPVDLYSTPIRQLIFNELSPDEGLIAEFCTNYQLVRMLQTGSFSVVYLIQDNKDKKHYALKIVQKNTFHVEISRTSPRAIEGEIHSKLDHPNIVKLHKYLENANHQVFLMEYASNGELFEHIRGGVPEPIAIKYFLQVLSAVEYLHQNDIFHRDLKPENILVGDDQVLKLTDFGFATRHRGSRRICGTPEYMAPETLNGHGYDHRIDIWCLGVLLYEIMTGTVPFNHRQKHILFRKILQCEYDFPETDNEVSDQSKGLIRWLMSPEPNDRPSFAEIKNHPLILKYIEKQIIQPKKKTLKTRIRKKIPGCKRATRAIVN